MNTINLRKKDCIVQNKDKNEKIFNIMDSCKLCNSFLFHNVLEFDKSIFSDGSKGKEPLVKEECQQCGTVRTKLKVNLKVFYKENYQPSRNKDTVVFSKNETINRSNYVYQWIIDLLPKVKLEKFTSIIEIGCGQGYLLDRFNIKKKFGIEPNKEASLHAKKIASVRNIGYEDIDANEIYDFIFSYCVIEHVDNPNDFLEKQYDILDNDGLMCIALPIQDRFNYDLVFTDHIHHFSHENFIKLLNKNGFSIVASEIGRGSYTNIGMYICEKKKKIDAEFEYVKNFNIENIKTIFNKISQIINQYENKKIYAFGYGEIAKTILPYNNLDSLITHYIDDFNVDNRVISSSKAKELFKNLDSVNLILLVNPVYNKKIKNLFSMISNINFIDIFENIETI